VWSKHKRGMCGSAKGFTRSRIARKSRLRECLTANGN
jgi:hypothetical protein